MLFPNTILAALLSLPLLWNCGQNNFYFSNPLTISSPMSGQTQSTFSFKIGNPSGGDDIQGKWEGGSYVFPKARIQLTPPEGWTKKSGDGLSIADWKTNRELFTNVLEPPDETQMIPAKESAHQQREIFQNLDNYPQVGEVSEVEIAGGVYYLLPAVVTQHGQDFAVYLYFKQAKEYTLIINLVCPPELYGLPEQENNATALLQSMIEPYPRDPSLAAGRWEDGSYRMDWAGFKINMPDGMRVAPPEERGLAPDEAGFVDYAFWLIEDNAENNESIRHYISILDAPQEVTGEYYLEMIAQACEQDGHTVDETQQRTISGCSFDTMKVHYESKDIMMLVIKRGDKFISITYDCNEKEQSDERALTASLEALIAPVGGD